MLGVLVEAEARDWGGSETDKTRSGGTYCYRTDGPSSRCAGRGQLGR